MLVNIVQIAMLILERRPVFLGEEELQLYRTIFHSLKPREFAKLLSIAEWKQGASRRRAAAAGQAGPGADAHLVGPRRRRIDGRRVAKVLPASSSARWDFSPSRMPARASWRARRPTTSPGRRPSCERCSPRRRRCT